MEVYAKAVKRRERLSGHYLAEFDVASEWAANGQPAPNRTVTPVFGPVEPAAGNGSTKP
jgi:hypothetical protein